MWVPAQASGGVHTRAPHTQQPAVAPGAPTGMLASMQPATPALRMERQSVAGDGVGSCSGGNSGSNSGSLCGLTLCGLSMDCIATPARLAPTGTHHSQPADHHRQPVAACTAGAKKGVATSFLAGLASSVKDAASVCTPWRPSRTTGAIPVSAAATTRAWSSKHKSE